MQSILNNIFIDIHSTSASALSIRAGSVDRLSGGVVVKVSKVVVHEDFLNDVGVLVLQNVLSYSSTIRAIPLATVDTPVGANVLISGWGHLSTGGVTPQYLQGKLPERYSHVHQQPGLPGPQRGQRCLPG